MSTLTDLQAALDLKTAAYAVLVSKPDHSEAGRSIAHIGHEESLLKQITELRKLIILETGTQISRTQVLT